MRLLLPVLLALTSFWSAPLMAQGYPSKPISLVVPFTAGAGTDVIGRALARQLETELGQPVVVENRTGAGSQVGTGYVARAAADGYTLLLVDPSVVTFPSLQASSPYQLSQLKPLATITRAPLIVVVHPSLPVKNLREFVDYSKAQPDGVSYASPGVGTTPHLAPELLRVQSGFKARHVPYRGGAASVPDLVGGRVHTAFYANATVLPLIKEGTVRAIAQTGTSRSAFNPDVPTAVESGFPDLVVTIWSGLFAPAGLPADVEKRLGEAVRKAVASEEFKQAMQRTGLEIFYNDAPAAEKFVQSEYERWNGVIKAAKIEVQ